MRIRRSAALAALALVATLGIWTTVEYRGDLARARARLAAGQRVSTPCGPLEYATRGEGPPVLVVHGAGGGFDQGLALGRGLSDRGWRVIAVSRFGYLGTPLPPDASAAAQADAHACLLDTLGIQRAAILGASAGAPSAVQLALRHPERVTALVLLVPALYAPRPPGTPSVTPAPGTRLAFATALRADFPFWVATRIASNTLVRALLATPPAVLAAAAAAEQRRVATLLDTILPVSARRLGLLNDAAITIDIERYPLERITAPTLTLSVRDDLFGTFDAARYSAEQIPGARFVGYETGGHVLVGNEDTAMADIAAFIGATSSTPP